MKKTKVFSFLLLLLTIIPLRSMYAGELHDAVQAKDAAKVRQLLEQRADINARGDYQRTPLHVAAAYGNFDVANLLIERGADVNARDKNKYTPLHLAAESGKTDVARLLIEKGADINALTEYQATPLHRAAGQGNVGVAALLLQKGASVNVRDWNQDTALHVAAAYGDTGASKQGDTVELAKLLIEKGADVNARNETRSTPLHRFAGGYSKTNRVAALLIEKGADLNARNSDGDTPAMVAEKRGKPELAAMLRKVGGGSARQDFDAKLQKTAKAGFVSRDDLQTIVRLARTLTPPPSVPQEAQTEMINGKAAFKLARRPEEMKEAEEHFRKASILVPWLPEPYYNLSVAQEKQYKWENARESLENYLIAAPEARDASAIRQKMAELDLQKRRWDDFEQEINIGAILYNKGPDEYNEAIRHWKRALELCPEHPENAKAHKYLAHAYIEKKNWDEALKSLQKVLELTPDDPVEHTNMGFVLAHRGDMPKACIYYKKGCDLGNQVGCSNRLNRCP